MSVASSSDSGQTSANVEFSLRDRIRAVLDGTTLADPREISAKVLAELTPEECVAALAITLPQYIRGVIMHSDRRVVVGQSQAAPNASAKLQQRRGWAEQLSTRWCVDGEWKLLRDCTRDDLLAIAADRRKVAAENAAVAERFERLASSFGPERGATVGDLDATAAEAAWGVAA